MGKECSSVRVTKEEEVGRPIRAISTGKGRDPHPDRDALDISRFSIRKSFQDWRVARSLNWVALKALLTKLEVINNKAPTGRPMRYLYLA